MKIGPEKAQEILFENYNIQGEASILPGELDANFKIKCSEKTSYILKVSPPNANEKELEFQERLLSYLHAQNKDIVAPQLVLDQRGETISKYTSDDGKIHKIRLLTWIDGRLWSSVNPQLDDLRYSLGEQCGKLTRALHGFDHKQAHRSFQWDVAQSLWTRDHLHLFNSEEQELLEYFQNMFEASLSAYNNLRKGVIHNDANDNNIVVSADLVHPKVQAIIDFGDAIYTQIINDVAIEYIGEDIWISIAGCQAVMYCMMCYKCEHVGQVRTSVASKVPLSLTSILL